MTQRILIKKHKVQFDQPPIVIGKGAMGEVHLAIYRNETVVVKKSQRDMDILLKEYTNYSKLDNHNNILKFFGVIRDSRHSFSLVLEHAQNGSLSSYLKTHTTNFNFKARVCRGIALGLMHCHNNNVLHFDLKPENILLDAILTPKLADFGISKSKSQMILDHGKAGGTLNYVAPERVCRDSKMREYFEKFPKLSDIYSFGLILWSVAKDGEHPFEGLDNEQIKEQKRDPHSMIGLLKQLPEDTPEDYSTLIMELIKYSPEERADLTFARLELENLSDDDEDDLLIPESSDLKDGLWLDPDLDDDEDDEDEFDQVIDSETPNSTSRSDTSDPMSTSTSLTSTRDSSSEKSELQGDKSNEKRNTKRSSNASRFRGSNGHRSSNNNTSVNEHRSVSDAKVIVDSPIAIEESSPPDGLVLNSQTNPIDKNLPLECVILQNTLEKGASNQRDLDIINKVYLILSQWEELTDSSIIKRIEALCLSAEIKPKDLLNIFESNPSESPDYYFVIGFFSEHAFGKVEDLKAAFENYSKAAGFEDPRGEVYLGWCYYKGMGIPKDPRKAFQAFQNAANQGCVSANNNVGWCYDIGFGVPSNPVKAFECFKASGEKGYATAQCRVGLCYEYGKGTAKDLEKALEWYTKAAESGLESSRRRANEISKMIAGGSKRRSFLWFFGFFRT